VTSAPDAAGAELHFLFGVHNHQPAGNFDGVIAEAAAAAYHPFFEALRSERDVALTVHCSGSLLGWLREHASKTFDLLGGLAAAGRVELLTGGFYEPILPMLREADKVGQIQRLTEFLRASFGVTPRGMWLAERVWEPHLPRALAAAGVEYVVVDDHHFALAGLDPEMVGGYYLTEDEGHPLAVFPISERLRYLVPFAEPGATLEYLHSRRGAGSVTLVDDGEKFGVWPGTHRLVYTEGWLRRFFDTLRSASWLAVSTFSRVLDSQPPRGRVYLPTASYSEMGDWSLPAPAAAEIEEARARLRDLPDGARLGRLLRGGLWRGFLVKYQRWATPTGACSASRAAWRRRSPTAPAIPRSSRHGIGSGAGRRMTPTGTACSAAAISRISAAPSAPPSSRRRTSWPRRARSPRSAGKRDGTMPRGAPRCVSGAATSR